MLISLTEYAKAHGLQPVSVRQKAQRGGLKTAQKIGRNWVIDSDEPYNDLRIRLPYTTWTLYKATEIELQDGLIDADYDVIAEASTTTGQPPKSLIEAAEKAADNAPEGVKIFMHFITSESSGGYNRYTGCGACDEAW